MKKAKKLNNFTFVTLLFYICLIFLPIFKQDDIDYSEAIASLSLGPIVNLIIYLLPIAIAVFFKKTNKTDSDSLFMLSLFDILELTIIYTELYTSSGSYIYTFIAILVLSFVCINISDLTTSIVLIPGLFMTKIGAVNYMLIAYIPLLILMLMKNSRKADSEEKKTSKLITLAYLYIAVFLILLFITKKIGINVNIIIPELLLPYNYINLFAAVVLVLAAFIMFIARALPLIKTGSFKEKAVLFFFAFYTLLFALLGIFTNLISENYKTSVMLALVIYVLGHIQLGITFKDEAGSVIPEKFKKESCAIAAVIIFCLFCFSYMY